jgi:integrase
MATIKRHGTGWQARIRRRGYPQQTKTFTHKAHAERWAREIEKQMDGGQFAPAAREAERVTLDEALARYASEITAKKRSPQGEQSRIRSVRAHAMAKRFMGALRGTDFASYRDELEERDLAANTIRLHLAVLSHLYTIARTEWGYGGLRNPLEDVAKPSPIGSERDRRLREGELDKLLLAEGAPAWLPSVIMLAVETAMRRSEIAGLADEAIAGSVARLALTKNGTARNVPLSPDALASIAALRALGGGKLRMPGPDAISHAFADARDAAGIKDLRLHDLRHEATSRLFESGLALQEVAAITGHKSWAMLKRYTHPRAEDLAKKLAARGGQKKEEETNSR